MRFQALMPDVLHWLGIKKVDKMVSMSDMKYDAIVKSGIPIWKRYDIPGELLPWYCYWAHETEFSAFLLDHLIPPDSRVEIDAKIAAGYFSSNKHLSEADLVKTVGRTWEETEHWLVSRTCLFFCVIVIGSFWILQCVTTVLLDLSQWHSSL